MIAVRRHKNRLEVAAMVLMVLGILMLVQPLTLVLFSYGFTVLLIGLVVYIVVSHF